MNQLLEWLPLLAFFLVFQFFGIYWATAALMLASVVVLAWHRRSTGKYKTIHLVTVGVVLVLGSATLISHDTRFLHWKPTILLGAASIAFVGSSFIGRAPLARRMLEGVFPEPIEVTRRQWLVLNAIWAAWFGVLAVVNLYIAFNFPEGVWVKFKVFGITIAMIVFMIPQVFWLNGKIKAEPA
jgi:intracellular septation protein